jgi:hypothetical protein
MILFIGGVPTKMPRGAIGVSEFRKDAIHHVTFNYVELVS